MPVRTGVVGVGVHGTHHVRLLSAIEDVELSGIVDIDSDVADRVSSEFKVRAFPSIEMLLEHVDCVSVAVPTSAHFEIVKKCLLRGKSVLVEKPIAASVSEAEVMIDEAEKRGLILSVGHIERFNSAYRSIMEYNIHPLFIESHRLSVFNPRGIDVAVVHDLMIHDIDIVLDMVKRPVVSVNAVGVSVVTDEIDIANARLEFEGGCVANLTASRISQKNMRKIRTFQKNSYVSMDFLSGESEIFTINPDKKFEALSSTVPQLMDGITYQKFENDSLNALELELSNFTYATKSGSPPKVTGRDGCRALEIASVVMENINASMQRIE